MRIFKKAHIFFTTFIYFTYPIPIQLKQINVALLSIATASSEKKPTTKSSIKKNKKNSFQNFPLFFFIAPSLLLLHLWHPLPLSHRELLKYQHHLKVK